VTHLEYFYGFVGVGLGLAYVLFGFAYAFTSAYRR
jgi:hypothetical protein